MQVRLFVASIEEYDAAPAQCRPDGREWYFGDREYASICRMPCSCTWLASRLAQSEAVWVAVRPQLEAPLVEVVAEAVGIPLELALQRLRRRASISMLTLLSELQSFAPDKTVQAPPPEFHDVAMELVLLHGNVRVQNLVVSSLTTSSTALVTDLADAACRHRGGASAAAAAHLWAKTWQETAGRVLMGRVK